MQHPPAGPGHPVSRFVPATGSAGLLLGLAKIVKITGMGALGFVEVQVLRQVIDLLRGESSRGQKGPFSPTLCLFSVI